MLQQLFDKSKYFCNNLHLAHKNDILKMNLCILLSHYGDVSVMCCEALPSSLLILPGYCNV